MTTYQKYKPTNFRESIMNWLQRPEVNNRQVSKELGMTPNKILDLKKGIGWTTSNEAAFFWWFCYTLKGPEFEKPPLTINR